MKIVEIRETNELIDAPGLRLASQGETVERNDLGTDATREISLVGADEMPGSAIILQHAPLEERNAWFVIHRDDFPDRNDPLLFSVELPTWGRGPRHR
ncbi:hypothetical protein [Burkholderia pyrrocinia]|uniref:hypothetical protein n=1 Tax=Burkholderia pyrrocinia TaxID=60550 RepID=UPI00126026C8|nr:hypothetical protein [Burkholderia pyrrocinia]